MSKDARSLTVASREACPLCGAAVTEALVSRDRRLHPCGRCGLVFAARPSRFGPEEAKKRYLTHENTIENKGYREFLSRAIRAARPFLDPGSRGLDYGCGPGPVLSCLLRDEGFVMADYDPLFFDRPLNPPYDFIFSTECFEHFEEPGRDIPGVLSLLRPGGVLTIMTELWNEATDFGKWYYAFDPTHVSFYSAETLDYICRTFGLRLLAGDDRRVFVYRKT